MQGTARDDFRETLHAKADPGLVEYVPTRGLSGTVTVMGTDGTESEDCTGRALWALGTTAHLSRDEGQRMLARQMFERGLPHATELGLRGTALTMLGLTFPLLPPALDMLMQNAARAMMSLKSG